MNRFFLTSVLGFAALLSASNVCRAQSSYFYGYYYPDEHRFYSSKLNMGIYTYSTVTPIWNAINDRNYDKANGLVPTGSPLLGPTYPSKVAPNGSDGDKKSAQPIVPSAPTQAVQPENSIRVIVPTPDAVVFVGEYQTKSTGTERLFQMPAVNPGTQSYQIKMAYNQDGRQLTLERTVFVSPGQSVVIDFAGSEVLSASAGR